MKNLFFIGLFFFFLVETSFAQNPSCPSPYVYMDGGSFIKVYDPSQPLSTSNPSTSTIPIPAGSGGLTLMPNINGGTLTPTFYTTVSGNYWYWNGAVWVNTGHSTGNGAAVNLGGCGGAIYNIVGGSGAIYKYTGTGNGTLLTTLTGFNGGGPYDLVTDCNCNFYALNTTSPNQGLTMYSPTGAVQCTYTLSGMPSTSAGGGFAIIGNTIYVKNNISLPGGFYIGTIAGGSITFTAVPGFTNSPGDFASCPVCYPATNLQGATISGALLGCTIPTVNLVVSTTVSPVTYSWTGPGIIGSSTGSFVVVNTPGYYYCVVYAGGCPPTQATLTTAVYSNSTIVLASITPSGNICVGGTATIPLVVAHSATTDIVTWSGTAMTPITGTDAINVPPGSYTVTVTDIFNGCIGRDVVNVIPSPTVNLALSDFSLCAQNTNGSPASLTMTPSGAANYTLLTSTNFSVTSPNGPVMVGFATSVFGNLSPLVTATLIGSSSICIDTSYASFFIVQNPTISVSQTSANICPGFTQGFAASGANTYVWGGSFGLNAYVGSNVIATPIFTNSIYSVIGNSSGCYSNNQNCTLTVLPVPNLSVSPTSTTICLGNSVNLSIIGNASSYAWYPASGLSSTTALNVTSSPASTQIYTVIGTLNTCTNLATTTVNIMPPPVLGLSLSTTSLCSQNYNGSPNSITMIPSGATNYTLFASPSIMVVAPFGPIILVSPTGPSLPANSVSTVTLVGESGVCKVSMTKTFTIVPNPVISISPPSSSICPGQVQNFTASGASTYTWLPAPGSVQTSNNSISASPFNTTFYSVIGSNAGCTSDIKNAVLVILPIPSVYINPATSTVCAGSAVNLAAIGNATSYQWWPSTALSNTIGSNVQSNPYTTLQYTILATLNTCTNTAVATVSAIPIPVITATASQYAVCSGAKTNLTAMGAGSYSWNPTDDLNYFTGNSVSASPGKNTTYTVIGFNGTCTGSTTIFIETIKRPDMQIKSEVNELCIGNSSTISVTGAQNYTWQPVSSVQYLSTFSLVSIKPLSNTNYTVYGANSVGDVYCYQQLSYSVMVVPRIIAVVSPSVSLCQGDKTSLSASGANTYSWTPNFGLKKTNLPSVVASPSSSIIYTVEVSHNTYCGVTNTVLVDIYPRPNVFAGRDTTYNLNDPIFISATGSGTLTWVAGEDIMCHDCPSTQIYPSRNGCYIVEATNEYNCKANDQVCITVTEDFTIYLPNTFSPNNDGINDVFLIYGENISAVSMEIYDRWGVQLFSSSDLFTGWNGKYKDQICQEGVYTYKINYTGLNRKKYSKIGNVNLIR